MIMNEHKHNNMRIHSGIIIDAQINILQSKRMMIPIYCRIIARGFTTTPNIFFVDFISFH